MSEHHLLSPKESIARRPPTPPLPLSPVSNPSTPPRKRQRTSSWQPPEYIPDFLPPFPTDEPRRSPSLPPQPADPAGMAASPVKLERPNTPPLQQAEAAAATTTSSANPSADYLTQIPYEESILSKQPAWHLPQLPPPSSSPLNKSTLPLPQTQPALLGAYHHILTNPPPTHVSSINPARYRAALALLAESETTPRWDAPTTLFSATAPNPPRVAPMPPSYAVPIGKGPGTPDGKEKEEEKRPNLPGAPPRTIVPYERLTPTVSQPGSRIPKLARQVLSVSSRCANALCGPALNSRSCARDGSSGAGVCADDAAYASACPPAGQPEAHVRSWCERAVERELFADAGGDASPRKGQGGGWRKRGGQREREGEGAPEAAAGRTTVRDVELRAEAVRRAVGDQAAAGERACAGAGTERGGELRVRGAGAGMRIRFPGRVAVRFVLYRASCCRCSSGRCEWYVAI